MCIAGFVVIFMPDAVRERLNTWFGTPTRPQHRAAAVDTSICANDWHERCLVCTQLDANGWRVTSTHC
jgi:hypothetical protein